MGRQRNKPDPNAPCRGCKRQFVGAPSQKYCAVCSGKRNNKRRPKPASDKQLRYLRNLSMAFGEKPPEVETAQQAHLAISALKRKLETAKRTGGATRAGIKGPLVG